MGSARKIAARIVLVGVVGAGLAATAGCQRPCQDLAEKTCARAGAGAPVCRKLRAVSADPSARDLQDCRAGLTFAEELEKN